MFRVHEGCSRLFASGRGVCMYFCTYEDQFYYYCSNAVMPDVLKQLIEETSARQVDPITSEAGISCSTQTTGYNLSHITHIPAHASLPTAANQGRISPSLASTRPLLPLVHMIAKASDIHFCRCMQTTLLGMHS